MQASHSLPMLLLITSLTLPNNYRGPLGRILLGNNVIPQKIKFDNNNKKTSDKMILQVGTNDLRSRSTPKVTANSIANTVTKVKGDSPGTDVGISGILVRIDSHKLRS